jgi:hypothetical protein
MACSLASFTLLASAQGTKVLGRLGHDVVEQLKHHTLLRLATDRDIKETTQAFLEKPASVRTSFYTFGRDIDD